MDSLDPRENLGWLRRFRWAMLGSLIFGTCFVYLTNTVDFIPQTALALIFIVLLHACTNLPLAKHLPLPSPQRRAQVLLLCDVLTLTIFFHLSGGPNNPFTVLYLAEVTLSLVILGFQKSILLILCSQLGFLSLFLTSSTEGKHHHHQHFGMEGIGHLEGMFVAFFLTSTLIAFFLRRFSEELSRHTYAKERLRDLQEEQIRLATLTAITSQSAHELASPLSHIAIATGELLSQQQDPLQKEELREIEYHTKRAKSLLERMVLRGREIGNEEPLEQLSVSALSVEFMEHLSLHGESAEVTAPPHSEDIRVLIPKRTLLTSIRSLVKNSREAGAQKIHISLTIQSKHLIIQIVDDGEGVAKPLLERLGQPFVSSKSIGEGMGLGIFVTKLLCQNLGGEFSLRSIRQSESSSPEAHADSGTCITISLPVICKEE
ncbi:ATP-binding protein [bacterium]|nr:ATP-binding protein [bacterium]